MQGVGSQKIAEMLNITIKTELTWRKKFTKQMEILGYHDLVHWFNWQLKCFRFSAAGKQAHSFRQQKHQEYKQKLEKLKINKNIKK